LQGWSLASNTAEAGASAEQGVNDAKQTGKDVICNVKNDIAIVN